MLETRVLLGLGFATALVFWGTPVAIRVAARFNFYDHPVGYKAHGAPTPYLGGAPVVAAFVAVVVVLTSDVQRTLPIAAGVTILWALGTLDDRRTVPPRVRVAVEAALAAMLFSAGLGWDLGGAPVLGLVATIVWVVAVVNALNLFDNMDGAASSIALVISGGIAVTGALQGDVWLAVAAAGLCGACLGFLPYNLSSPARIFLGDGGSMPIGFALAALVMTAAAPSGPTWQALAIGILLVGVPALDTCLVIVSRTRRGVSILTAGRDHLTHRTLRRLRTTRAVAVALGSVQALLATLALFASRQSSSLLLLAVVVLYLTGAATAIALFDRQAEPGAASQSAQQSAHSGSPRPAEFAVLVVLGLGAGISPFFAGFYDEAVWGPIGLGLIFLVAALGIARPTRPSGPGLTALAALGALGLLGIVSSAWADAGTSAFTNGNRYLVYALFLAVVLMLVRDRRAAAVLVASFAAGAVAVAAVDLVAMLDGRVSLFLGGRLNDPLGYINGQGDFFLLAAWPCIALAEQRRHRWLAGASLAAAGAFVCLAFMSQSRGVMLAGIVSLLVVVAIAPGRRRRLSALTVLGIGVAVAAPDLIDVFSTRSESGVVSAGAAADAARAVIVASVAVGLVWWAALGVERLLETRGGFAVRGARLAVSSALAVIAVAGLTVALIKAEPLGREVDRQYSAFVHLDPTQGGDSVRGRLVSGGGNRYDYWRVAARTWLDHRGAGVGGGNYPEPYYRMRQTVEPITQPHSIELQTLAELGVLGGVLLAVILGTVAVGVARARSRARAHPVERGLLVACVGVLATWSVHTSVDWIHLLPGVTAAALIAVAILLRSGPSSGPSPRPARSGRRVVVIAASAVAIALAATSLTRQVLSDRFRTQAQSDLARSPAEALKWADRSLRLDPEAMPTYYVKAAALARFGSGRAAEQVLQTAIHREPGNFLTYALLGDLYTRQGKLSEARTAYRSALERNPREPALLELARDPRGALGTVR
jgi:UDP-GlcNAc:undecaprenyl-phosphate GlcNAc-1-phosphate transferase